MKWDHVREQSPGQWVIFEATFASEKSNCYIDELSVISNFPDSPFEWIEYKKQHIADPSREYYIFQTDYEKIEVQEQKFIGVRKMLQ